MKIFLLITGMIFVVIGLRGLFKPVETVADLFSLKIQGKDALSQLRATAGGVTTLCGVVMMAAFWVGWLQLPALVLTTAILGGMFVGRLYSLLADGGPSAIVWFSGSFEVFGLVQAAFWLAAYMPSTP